MAWQLDVGYLNQAADLFETYVGANPTLVWFDGAMPATLASADAGVVIGTTTLTGANWLNAASGGLATLITPTSMVSVAIGTIRYVRLKSSGGTVRGQGEVTDLNGTGPFRLSQTVIATIGQSVLLSAFTHGFG